MGMKLIDSTTLLLKELELLDVLSPQDFIAQAEKGYWLE